MRRLAIFWAPPSDVRWRLCPTVGEAYLILEAAPLVLGRSPIVLIASFGRSETFRTSGGGAAKDRTLGLHRSEPVNHSR